MTMPQKRTQQHRVAAEIINNADLYDLIKISMRSSDSKLQSVDQYIQNIDNNNNNNNCGAESLSMIDHDNDGDSDCNNSVLVQNRDENCKIVYQKGAQHVRNQSAITEAMLADSPIKEPRAVYNYQKSNSISQQTSNKKSENYYLQSPMNSSPQTRQALEERQVN